MNDAKMTSWNGVMPPTWSEVEAIVKCSEKFKELVVPILQTAESTKDPSTVCAYIYFSVCRRASREVFSWVTRSNCKLEKNSGGRITGKYLKQAGWRSLTIWECVNMPNMIKAEKETIRLLMNQNLPYHSCINEQAITSHSL